MPVVLSYPGVYLDELPSGSRTITGVATSVAAFVGRALRGPENTPVTIKNFTEFERQFGGLWGESTMSYAVSHFFLNGGADARIVRVGNGTKTATLALPEADEIVFRAKKSGVTGSIVIASVAGDPRAFQLTAPGLAATTVSTDPSAVNYVGKVLADVSVDVQIAGSVPSTAPQAGTHVLASTSGGLSEVSVSVPVPRISFAMKTGGAAANGTTITIGAGTAADEFTIDVPGGPGVTTVTLSNVGTTLGAAAWPIQLSGSAPAIVPLPGKYTLGAGTDAVTAAKASVDIQVGAQTLQLEAKSDGSALNGTDVTITAGATASEFNIAHGGQTALVSTDTAAVNNIVTVLGGAAWTIQPVGAVPSIPPAAGSYTLAGGRDQAASVAARVDIDIRVPVMKVTAANGGKWGNAIRVRVDFETSTPTDGQSFNLFIEELSPGSTATSKSVLSSEVFRNVSTSKSHKRFVEEVVKQESSLVDVTMSGALRPATSGLGSLLSGGDDGLAVTDNDIAAGIDDLERVDIFTLLCTPPLEFDSDVGSITLTSGLTMCQRRNAMYIVDAPESWNTVAKARAGATNSSLSRDEHVAMYFPRLSMPDPLQEGRLRSFAPCGVVAGVMARTDARRGIWKAPAGTEATTLGVRGLTVDLTDDHQGDLNKLALNCVRRFPITGHVIWGARTWRGADALASEWKYVPVRRLAMFIKETLLRNSKWIVFEPNDEPLWSQIRMSFGGFMHGLFRQGAFQGDAPDKAYFVKCDAETTTQTDRANGVVNIIVGFAPLRPAEFVVIKLQQIAGQSE